MNNFSGDIEFKALPTCDDCTISEIEDERDRVFAQDAANSGDESDFEILTGVDKARAARCRRLHLQDKCTFLLTGEVELS